MSDFEGDCPKRDAPQLNEALRPDLSRFAEGVIGGSVVPRPKSQAIRSGLDHPVGQSSPGVVTQPGLLCLPCCEVGVP
jgi:hypothetical protein